MAGWWWRASQLQKRGKEGARLRRLPPREFITTGWISGPLWWAGAGPGSGGPDPPPRAPWSLPSIRREGGRPSPFRPGGSRPRSGRWMRFRRPGWVGAIWRRWSSIWGIVAPRRFSRERKCSRAGARARAAPLFRRICPIPLTPRPLPRLINASFIKIFNSWVICCVLFEFGDYLLQLKRKNRFLAYAEFRRWWTDLVCGCCGRLIEVV